MLDRMECRHALGTYLGLLLALSLVLTLPPAGLDTRLLLRLIPSLRIQVVIRLSQQTISIPPSLVRNIPVVRQVGRFIACEGRKESFFWRGVLSD